MNRAVGTRNVGNLGKPLGLEFTGAPATRNPQLLSTCIRIFCVKSFWDLGFKVSRFQGLGFSVCHHIALKQRWSCHKSLQACLAMRPAAVA